VVALKRIRRRLVRVQKDVEQIEAELERYGLEEDVAKARALSRLKDLEAALRKHSPHLG
jgi:hypothetical protein